MIRERDRQGERERESLGGTRWLAKFWREMKPGDG